PASSTSSVTSRASYCSEALRWNVGQCAAPGMMDLRCASIWQPLHMPTANFDGSAKNAELFAQVVVVQDRRGPATARAQHVAVGKTAAGGEARELRELV